MEKTKLSALNPGKVFHFFEEICSIPHGSYHIEQISDYLAEFARKRNLKYVQDSYKNVIIYKPATIGYEAEETLIIQGHMDMVAVKEADCDLDLRKDGLRLAYDRDYLWAEGTSLGGDDGIAVAYALAILDSEDISHPALEAVFTVNEEVGMDGAIGLDASLLNGKRMLNIDSEEEGILTVGCAGGTKLRSRLPVRVKEQTGDLLRIEVNGLGGGHSGVMIHLGRANACILLARLLWDIMAEVKPDGIQIYLSKISGGEKSNAIPTSATAEVILTENGKAVSEEAKQKIMKFINKHEAMMAKEYDGKEKEVHYEASFQPGISCLCADEASTKDCIRMLIMQPDGVISKNAYLEKLVETSLNMGIMELSLEHDNQYFTTTYELRSSMQSSMSALCSKVKMIAESLGANCDVQGEYPQWEYRKDSPLQEKMICVYREKYGKEPVIDIIHAGLECGVFASKIKELDAVSFGPNILDIHTTKEKLDIASTERVWEFLLALLAKKDE